MASIRVHVIMVILILLIGGTYGNIYDEILPEVIVSGENANVRFVTTRTLNTAIFQDNDNGEEEEEPPVIFAYNDVGQAMEEANPGDFLFFLEGTYTGNLVVNKPLFLMGGFPDDGRDFAEYTLESRNWWHHRVNIQPAGEGSVVILDGNTAAGLILFDGFEVSGGSGTQSGGGIVNIGGAVFNCFVHNSSSDFVGGGIYNHGGYIINTLIYDNYAAHYGGGIYNNEGYVQNCTVARNESKYGGGIYQYRSDPEVELGSIVNTVSWYNENSDIHNHGGTVLNSCFKRPEGSEDSFEQDPIFANPGWEGPDPGVETGFLLHFDSPLINAGTVASEQYIILPYDITVRDRVSGDTIDIGAYEYQEDEGQDQSIQLGVW